MAKNPLLTIADKDYRFIRSRTELYGYHLSPKKKKPGIIAVHKSLKHLIELDTTIHEMLHACAPFGDEVWVNNSASDIAKALWDLGYRKQDDLKKKKGKKTNKQLDV
jgi:hypothetical protein